MHTRPSGVLHQIYDISVLCTIAANADFINLWPRNCKFDEVRSCSYIHKQNKPTFPPERRNRNEEAGYILRYQHVWSNYLKHFIKEVGLLCISKPSSAHTNFKYERGISSCRIQIVFFLQYSNYRELYLMLDPATFTF